ncbi:MAG TPA: methylglyoxal synthase [Flavobacteriales bacterium]|jgi:methylglyoxal synthase|nr:methylglyoxal synthase [Flavobacteriales bacterium]
MKYIALIAHDGKKDELVEFVSNNREFFSKVPTLATHTTGSKLKEKGIDVETVASGPRGGDAQIASRITEGKVAGVIFFRDPMGKHPHEPDINMLLRLCDVYNIPLATNPATAELIARNIA